MEPEDFALLLQFLNFGTALLAAVIIAWTRHDPPQAAEPERVIQFVHGLDSDFTAIREREDLLADADKQVIRRMVENGTVLSFRSAQVYGLKRAAWNKTRSALVSMGLAEYRRDGTLEMTANGNAYLRIPGR